MIRKSLVLAIFLNLCFQAQGQLRFVKEVDTIAQLKTLNTLDINKSVSVAGYLTPNDGGGGLFKADPNSIEATDDGIVILPNNGQGRWRRVVAGRDYHALWWGGVKTNAILQAAIDWVSANGWGRVIVDGGRWILKCDDSTRILMKTGVTLTAAEDSQLECAPNPADNWILIDFPLGSHDMQVGPARLLGWNLAAPGGNPTKTGVIFSIKGTENVTIGGIKANNWWSRYIDADIDNRNLNLFDDQWQPGVRAFGAFGDGVTDDTISAQDAEHFYEFYSGECFWPPTTNGYLLSSIWITNQQARPVKMKGNKTLIKQYYYNPTEGVLPHPSGAFIISANNAEVSGFRFTTVGSYPATETNTATTGFFVPIQVHNGTNTLIENCEFDVESGKGISSSGSYTRIRDCFFNRCGITFGLGNYDDWLFYENTSPAKGIGHSPLSVSVMNCTFIRGSPYKHCVFFSAANDFVFTGNKLLDMNCPNPLLIYSGDLGTTDALGTNVYRFSGTVSHNTITGTNFGANGAICLRLNTTTNYVPATFFPSNMYSAVIISENQVQGTGLGLYSGIQLISGSGTRVLNNIVSTTMRPLHLVGDSDSVVIRGNQFESTIGDGITIPLSEGFEAPPSFRDMVIEDNSIISAPGEEYAIRNVEPIFVKNPTIRGNKFTFLGAAGAGDAPKVIQFSASQGYVDASWNTFYLTNSMSGRRVATFSGTNSDLTFSHNRSIILPGSTVTLRGVQADARNAAVNYNEVGSCEFNDVLNLTFSGNIVSSGDAYPYALETFNVGRAIVTGNFMTNYFAGSTFVAVIRATNSILEGNTIVGNSASSLVTSGLGKMYVGNNNIINLGSGVPWVSASPPGTVTHTIYERSLHLDTGAFADTNVISFRRDGSPATATINVDNIYTSSDRSVIHRVYPDSTNDLTGFAFFVNSTNGVQQYAFGAQGSDAYPVFRIGDSSNNIATFIGGLGTNTMFYLDNNRILQPVTMGGNMTFVAGTLNSIAGGGGGSTNDTPWNVDHDANLFSLTNAFKVTLRHTDASAVSMTVSNVNAASTFGIDTLGNAIINSGGPGSMKVQLAGTDHLQLSAAALSPGGAIKAMGTTLDKWSQGIFGPGGVDIGGVSISSGSGSPEGVVIKPVGSMYLRTNGVAGTMFYIKETGVGNTGWVAYKSSATGTIPTTIAIACSDLTTAITAGTFKGYIRMPYAMTVSSVKASLAGAQTAGSIFTVDINETGTTILSTKLTIDNSEKTSTTAATAAVVSDTSLANDAEISVDVDQAGTSPTGLIVYLEGLR